MVEYTTYSKNGVVVGRYRLPSRLRTGDELAKEKVATSRRVNLPNAVKLPQSQQEIVGAFKFLSRRS